MQLTNCLLHTQLLRLSDVDAKTGKPITEGHVRFFALDTLLQFARFEQVPEADKEAVRQRFFEALDHSDLGICTLGERVDTCHVHALSFAGMWKKIIASY